MGINGDCLLFRISLSVSVSFSASVIHCELNCCAVGSILVSFLSVKNNLDPLSFAFGQMVFTSPLKYVAYAMSSWRQRHCSTTLTSYLRVTILPEWLKRKPLWIFRENRFHVTNPQLERKRILGRSCTFFNHIFFHFFSFPEKKQNGPHFWPFINLYKITKCNICLSFFYQDDICAISNFHTPWRRYFGSAQHDNSHVYSSINFNICSM